MITANLSWTDTSDNESGFYVYRSTVSSPSFPADFTQIDSVGANTTSYTDSSTPEVATLTYAVTAYNTAGESSPATSATFDTAPKELASTTVDRGVVSNTVRVERTLSGSTADTDVVDTSVSLTRTLLSNTVDTSTVTGDTFVSIPTTLSVVAYPVLSANDTIALIGDPRASITARIQSDVTVPRTERPSYVDASN